MATNNTNTLYIVTTQGTDPIAVYGKQNLVTSLQEIYGESEGDALCTRIDGVISLTVGDIDFLALPQDCVYGEAA